ncbi:hypothetical protein [Thermocrinis minervae]|nr:hypothetical protein [Thermocrinis minervae]
MVFVRKSPDPEKLYQALKPLHTTLKEQFFTEKLYHKVLAAGYMMYSKLLYQVGDKLFIDGVVNGLYHIVSNLGHTFKLVQSGKINTYMLFMAVGLALLLLLIIFGG